MIINIANQPWRFREENEINAISCNCLGAPYFKIVGKNDTNCFQIQNDTEAFQNGDFEGNLDGWSTITSLNIDSLVSSNESAVSACDGDVTVTVSGGTAPYSYSLDGVTFQISNTFTLLCSGNYTIFVKDANNLIITQDFGIGTNVNCLLYSGSEAFDVLALDAINVKECEAFNFV